VLAVRRYLVVLKFQCEAFRFPIKSNEADTPHEALAIALDYLRNDRNGLGPLVEHPKVLADTEEARAASGINFKLGYPRADDTRGRSSYWYDEYCDTRGCLKRLTPWQLENGRLCETHRPKHNDDILAVETLDLKGKLRLVERHGLRPAAEMLGCNYEALKKSLQRYRARGLAA
jgi:hypothetical protein